MKTTNDIVFDMHKDSLKNKLREGLSNMGEHMFVHLSHDDLDGYGCTIVTYLEQWARQHENAPRKNVPCIVSSNYIFHNTNQLNKDMYPVLDGLLSEAMATTHHRKIYCLITDIGGIELDDLITRYRKMNAGDITFLIVDHHRSIYQMNTSDMFDQQGIHVYHDAEDNTMACYRDGSRFKVDMYITNGKISATRALVNLLHDGTISMEPNIPGWYNILNDLVDFSIVVSEYDTGNVGEWYIPNNGDMYEYYRQNVSDQAKLNSWWKCAYQAQKDHPSSMRRFIVEVASCIATGTTFCSMREQIYTRIVKISEDYETFVSKCEIIVRNTGEPLRFGKGKSLQIPESMDDVRVFAVYWHDDPKEFYPPLTMYSKKFLPEHLGIDVLMIANEVRSSIDTRSHKDYVNMYEICKFNGGGGHPKAAGCPMK